MATKLTLEHWKARCLQTHCGRYNVVGFSTGKIPSSSPFLDVVCQKHGVFSIRGSEMYAGGGCASCHAERRKVSPKRLSLGSWVDRFKPSDLTYSKVDYRDGMAYVTYTCSAHGDVEQSCEAHQKTGQCKECAKDRNTLRLKSGKVPEQVWLDRFKVSHGDKYSYGAFSYRPANGKLIAHVELICAEHGTRVVGASNLMNGHGCLECGWQAAAAKKTLATSDWLSRAAAAHGSTYEYVGFSHRAGTQVFKYVCKVHGMVEQNAQWHVRGAGCPKCSTEESGRKRRVALSEWVNRFHKHHGDMYKYEDLVPNSGGKMHVFYTCPTHGARMQSAADHARGFGCNECTPSGVMGNKHTKEISDYLISLGVSTLQEHSFMGSKKRWDIVVPESKLAIEFDGIYFHSEKFKKDRSAMAKKAIEASDSGYRQINIFEDEWYEKKAIVKKLLASAVGKSLDQLVHARKTVAVEVTANEAKVFMACNHIQGFVGGSNYIGLKYGDILVACMVYSYKAAGRATGRVDNCVDIQRYATNSKVVGGFQKLLSQVLKDKNVTTVVSYSDPRLFDGNTYKVAGFTPSKEGTPDYCYVKGAKRIPKRARQKSWFVGRDDVLYDPDLTEHQLALLNGYHRLWFRGKVRWTLNLSRY